MGYEDAVAFDAYEERREPVGERSWSTSTSLPTWAARPGRRTSPAAGRTVGVSILTPFGAVAAKPHLCCGLRFSANND
jgi:hypothetical protein